MAIEKFLVAKIALQALCVGVCHIRLRTVCPAPCAVMGPSFGSHTLGNIWLTKDGQKKIAIGG